MKAIRLLLALALLTLATAVQAKVFLVAVGINAYPTPYGLKNCANDAKIMDWVYKKNSQGKLSSHAVCRLILDKQATPENIMSAMREVYSQAKKKDQIVFYFSGHGNRDLGGEFYCCNLKPVTYEAVREIMAQSKAREKIVFIDACHSGSMRQETTAATTPSKKNNNVMVFMAARNEEYSIEKRGMKNGIFTAYLQNGLKGGADANRDRKITARELFEFVSDGVKKESRGEQHPVMWGNFNDNMVVMAWPEN